ncbi:unnamed protein product [Polarella glacialis]|uniref:Uncharacterized protein n=1 Tax=Polarella glacialis TaxID=89957 RepID=A0A813FAH0_POLGL|nr:unnamed protein product [Polarella glacialis]
MAGDPFSCYRETSSELGANHENHSPSHQQRLPYGYRKTSPIAKARATISTQSPGEDRGKEGGGGSQQLMYTDAETTTTTTKHSIDFDFDAVAQPGLRINQPGLCING